jgi:hypothetical protein
MLAVARATAVLCALIGHVQARCSDTPDSFTPSLIASQAGAAVLGTSAQAGVRARLEHCHNCGGELKIIAAILEQPVIETSLTRLGLQARAPRNRSPCKTHASL